MSILFGASCVVAIIFMATFMFIGIYHSLKSLSSIKIQELYIGKNLSKARLFISKPK